MIRCFHYSCEGESHKATGKVCQDFSLTSNMERLTIAIVCDGHGGERYFRSDIGARYAAEVTLEVVSSFVKTVDICLFKNKPFTAIGPMSTLSDTKDLSQVDFTFRQLFSSIIYRWNEKINQHAHSVDLSEWERTHVPQKYLEEFSCSESFEKQYGCTMIAYVQTPDYWFAFQIGDGKCLSFQESPIWSEPIPWDDKCFLNKTTSLCDPSALEEFRYCYQGDGHFPVAVILGSDGLDDSFGEINNLANFYIQILKMLFNDGQKITEDSLKETLPQLSKIGSKDDMSVACVYDPNALNSIIVNLIQNQIDLVLSQIHDVDTRIEAALTLLNSYDQMTSLDEKARIGINYAQKDISKWQEERIKLLSKHDILTQQLSFTLSTKIINNGTTSSNKRNNGKMGQ